MNKESFRECFKSEPCDVAWGNISDGICESCMDKPENCSHFKWVRCGDLLGDEMPTIEMILEKTPLEPVIRKVLVPDPIFFTNARDAIRILRSTWKTYIWPFIRHATK